MKMLEEDTLQIEQQPRILYGNQFCEIHRCIGSFWMELTSADTDALPMIADIVRFLNATILQCLRLHYIDANSCRLNTGLIQTLDVSITRYTNKIREFESEHSVSQWDFVGLVRSENRMFQDFKDLTVMLFECLHATTMKRPNCFWDRQMFHLEFRSKDDRPINAKITLSFLAMFLTLMELKIVLGAEHPLIHSTTYQTKCDGTTTGGNIS